MSKVLPAVILIVILAAIGIGAVAFSNKNTVSVISVPSTPTARQVTLSGKVVCLPHKNADGPQTLECAFGMLADDGAHYALDWSVVDPQGTNNLPMDKKYSVTGLLTPIEAVSSNFWNRYNIRGIMKVESYREVGGVPVFQIVKVSLNETSAAILNTTIKVWAVTEDSRCPSDVQCIQAGRVRIGLNITSPSGGSVHELQPGQTITTETLAITLDSVDPVPVSTRKTADNEYRFKFTVKSR